VTVPNKNLPTAYQEIIHRSRYARFLPESNRRETWEETVDRLISYLSYKILEEHGFSSNEVWEDLRTSILNLEIMPSMRLLMTAGEACERDNIAAYNCSYLAINNKRAFSEALYILMNGTGVGFSCERQEIVKLPIIPEAFREAEDVIVVQDSKLGWAKAFKKLLSSLWEGDIPKVDYSRVRPAGARLKTFGGRASGHEPLKRLFEFVISTFKEAAGRKLNSLEVHDILCMIGEIVVVGGVRRSALISLSNLTDRRMREAKMGAWYNENPHRGLANNSVAYTEKPDSEVFLEEWLALVRSKSGERGIFNRKAAQAQASKWGRRSVKYEIEFEDGSIQTYKPTDVLQTKRGSIPAYSLLDTDEIL
jgi:ribonucleoside-triphosphate reductase